MFRLRHPFSGVFPLLAALVLSACPGGRPDPSPAAPSPEAPATAAARADLELVASPGEPASHELSGGQSRVHRISLERGEYLHVTVEQLGVDVEPVLLDPGGGEVFDADGPTGVWGREEVFWIAEVSGEHRLRIASSKVGVSGRYRVSLEGPRSAGPEDRLRAGAALSFAVGEKLRRQGRKTLPEAIAKYREALSVYEELGESTWQVNALHRVGLAYRELGDPREAIRAYESALPLFAANDDLGIQGYILHGIGLQYYESLGQMEPARRYYEQARELRRELPDRTASALTSNNLILVYFNLGEFQKALALSEEVLAQWRELGDRSGEAMTLHNRGKCYFYLGNVEQAFDDLSAALAVRLEIGDRGKQAATLNAIGLVHEARGELQRAHDVFLRALEIRKEVKDRYGQAVTLSSLGRTHGRLGQADRALLALNEALAIFRESGSFRQEALVLLDLGSLLFERGKNEEALVQLRQALPLLETIGEPDTEIAALVRIAVALRAQGRLQEARRRLEDALSKVEALRDAPASHALRSSYFATKQDHYELYIDLLMELHRSEPGAGYDAKALAASERTRARSQLEALTESGANVRHGADPRLLEREQGLERKISGLELQRLQLLDDGSPAHSLARIGRQLRDLLRKHEHLRGEIRLSSPGYRALVEPQPLSAGEIQRLVDRETLLLHYKLGKERSFLWAVAHDGVVSFELPARARIEDEARRAYTLLTESHRREGRVATRIAMESLGEMLLGQASASLAQRRLLIVSEGALQYIPFGALRLATGQGESRPLVFDHEISRMPSASMLAELRRQRAGRPLAEKRLAVVADPVFQSHDPRLASDSTELAASALRGQETADLRRFERLVFSRQEADAILALVDDEQSFRALGFAANRDTVTSGELGHYQIVHFATHAYLDTANPALSGLVLSLLDEDGREREGFLLAHEIYNLELQAELVVLSACQTALGQEIRGEGLVGLTQGFMYAGSTRVLVSLWPVNDEATARLMERFYGYLLQERRQPAGALRAAQGSISRERSWQAPYYWAGFVLQGDW